jgi:hypothetical protein
MRCAQRTNPFSRASPTRDSDHQDPWSSGNIPTDTLLGRALIVQKTGSLFFDFAFEIDSFGFDLVDIEGPSEYGDNSGYFATFSNNDTVLDPESPADAE